MQIVSYCWFQNAADDLSECIESIHYADDFHVFISKFRADERTSLRLIIDMEHELVEMSGELEEAIEDVE